MASRYPRQRGLCFADDWSARDLQAWEYQPLGPFLAKSFATTLSPWTVTLEALEPFRTEACRRAEGDPPPLPYLCSGADPARGAFDITLEVLLRSERMRERRKRPSLLSRGNFRTMYWTIAQLLAHHASNGCNLRPGDLLARGTVSGPDRLPLHTRIRSRRSRRRRTHEPAAATCAGLQRRTRAGDRRIRSGPCRSREAGAPDRSTSDRPRVQRGRSPFFR